MLDFPKLSMDDLKRLTLGTYQIEIAKKYFDHHMKGDEQFGIFIYRDTQGLVRAKIQSRFNRSKEHSAWVKYDQNGVGYSAITGLYCTCKSGERSLGRCSHLTSVFRYLGYDRGISRRNLHPGVIYLGMQSTAMTKQRTMTTAYQWRTRS